MQSFSEASRLANSSSSHGQGIFLFGVSAKSGQNFSKPVACLAECPISSGFHESRHYSVQGRQFAFFNLPVITIAERTKNLKYLFCVMLSKRLKHLSSSQKPVQLAMCLRLQMFAISLFVWWRTKCKSCSIIVLCCRIRTEV